MTTELTMREPGVITPAEIVENATAQARLLMSIVEQTKCYQNISGKKYLQVEAWETIGAFNRVHAVTQAIIPIIRDGETIGYEANVELLRDGETVGGAIMPCYFTENACKGKEGDAKHKAAMSAAQTFATSKAYRMNYSYVAILAGYQPTPAEEMTGEAVDDRPANLEHWCEKHKTKFFKRGKMPAYAHPIGKTGEWCNEHIEDKPATSARAEELKQKIEETVAKVQEERKEQPEPSKEEHYCKLHSVNFFMKGKMKAYAHPIGDTGKWCYEHAEYKIAEPVLNGEQLETSQPEVKAEAAVPAKPKRDSTTIKNFGDLYTACKADWGMSREAVWKELGVTSQIDLSDTPAELFLRIAAVRQVEP